MIRSAVVVTFALVSCARPHATQLPDGTFLVECDVQTACFNRAERQCGSSGYIIVGGQSSRKVYGAPGNEKAVGKDQMRIRCKTLSDLAGLAPASSSANAAPLDASAPAAPAPANHSVCRPGETQKCVGPAACEGGQACVADGSGFGPCDCGSPSAKRPLDRSEPGAQ